MDALLWTSGNPRFGTVRKVVIDGSFAAKLDDLNSDYREVELTIFQCNRSGWDRLLISVDDSYPGVHETTANGFSDGYAFVVGRERPGDRIAVWLRGEPHTVETDPEGWWLFVREDWPPGQGARWEGSYLRWSVDEDMG